MITKIKVYLLSLLITGTTLMSVWSGWEVIQELPKSGWSSVSWSVWHFIIMIGWASITHTLVDVIIYGVNKDVREGKVKVK